MAEDRLRQIAEAKAKDRRLRAQRPYPEKIRALIKMQERKAAIGQLRGKTVRVWKTKI